MKKYIFLLSLILFSCGAKKVNKQHSEKEVKTETIDVVKKDVVIDTNVKVETKTFTVDSTKEEIEEIEVTPIDNLKPAIFEGKEITNSKVIKRKIKRNKAIKAKNNINILSNEKTTDKTTQNTKKQDQTKENIETKVVDKKQFDPLAFVISYWWLWLIIVIVLFLLKKYRNLVFS